jgi:hypothetical protein
MIQNNKILILGMDPTLVDFQATQFDGAPNLSHEKVAEAIKLSVQELTAMGLEIVKCTIDLGETAVEVLRQKLAEHQYKIILLGAGIRVPYSNFLLFEKLINCIHENAPEAKICFNTNPSDTTSTIKRWL